MIFAMWLALIWFAKGWLLDMEDDFFKFSVYGGNEEDTYAAALAWVNETGHEWNWDIGNTLNNTFDMIDKLHEAMQDEWIKEWATQGKFDIVIPGCGLTIELIKDFVLQDLPEWLTGFDSTFTIDPLKSVLTDEGLASRGYYAMRKRTTPCFTIDGTENFMYTVDGVKDYGYNFDPEQALNDRNLSAAIEKGIIFSYWTNLFYHILKSQTMARWVSLMCSSNASYKRWIQMREITNQLEEIGDHVDDVDDIYSTLQEISGKIGLKLFLH